MQVLLWLVQAALIVGKVFEIEPVGAWSWWAVLAPLWVIGGLGAVVLLVIVALSAAGYGRVTVKRKTDRLRI